jgi:signal transduction histidine kinase
VIRIPWKPGAESRRGSGLGGYERQIQVFLLVLVVLLVFANLVSFHILFDAIAEQDSTVRAWAAQEAMELAAELAEAPARVPRDGALLRALARSHSLQALVLIDGEGRRLASWPTLAPAQVDPLWAHLTPRQQQRAREGMSMQLDQEEIVEASLITTFVGVRGPAPAVLRVDRPQGRGPLLARRARLFSYCYAAAVLVSLGAIFLFTRWVMRPYRLLLSRAAERAGVRPLEPRGSDAEDLISVFQTILERLHDQEEALGALRGAGGGGWDEAVMNSMGSGVLLAGRDGGVRRFNRAAARLLDLPEDADAAQMSARLAGCPDLAERLRECVEQGTRVARGLMRLPRAAAPGERHLGVSVSPVRGAGREVEGALCLFSDLTEIHALEERERARDSLAAVGELSAGIAHEFRNALHTIDGYARLVERATPGGEEARAHAQAIRREARETGQVVEEFLRFARPARLTRAPADLCALAREAASEVAGQYPAVRWQIDIPQVEIRAEVDAALLRPALQNLLRNAAEAVSEAGGGEVRFRLASDPGSADCRLEISDSGPGIDPRDMPHLFTPFFTTKERGSGLGLPLARKAILAHDGEIEVESAPGRGSEFRVRLPVLSESAARETAAQTPATGGWSR